MHLATVMSSPNCSVELSLTVLGLAVKQYGMSYLPPGVDKYSGMLEVFVIEDVVRRLSAGLTFTAGGDARVWCASCLYEHGQPDNDLMRDAQSIDIAMREDDPMSAESSLITQSKDHLSAPHTECDKCGQDVPMVEMGDRAIDEDMARAELGVRERDDSNTGFEPDVSELAEDFEDRFDEDAD